MRTLTVLQSDIADCLIIALEGRGVPASSEGQNEPIRREASESQGSEIPRRNHPDSHRARNHLGKAA